MVIEFLAVYIVYLLLIILGNYYVHLFTSKEQYTREEIKNVTPYLLKCWNTVRHYSLSMFLLLLLLSSFIGAMMPLIFQNWFFNSSIIFVPIFFFLPYLKKNYEQAQVTTPDDYSDAIVNIFVKYCDVLIVGFGLGLGAMLIYNWAVFKLVHFIWFFINIVAVTVLIFISIRNVQKRWKKFNI